MVAAFLPLAAPDAGASDWPSFLGADGTGVSDEANLARGWPVEGPPALWSLALAPGYGGAAVRDGEVFIVDRLADAVDVLLCLDLYTGEVLWRQTCGRPGRVDFSGTRSTPTVTEDSVYVATAVGDLCRVSRRTRQVVWRRGLTTDFGGSAVPQWGFGQSPVLCGDVVLGTVPEMPRRDRPSSAVVALDRWTGELRWRTVIEGWSRYSFSTPLVTALSGQRQVLCFYHKTMMKNPKATVVSLDADNGRPLWRHDTPGPYNIPIPRIVDVGDDRLFVAGGYRAGAFMLEARRQGTNWLATVVFTNSVCTPHIQTPVLYDRHLYVQSFDSYHNKTNSGLLCTGLDGRVRWKTGPDRLFDNGNVLAADGLLFVMDGRTCDLTLAEASPESYRPLACARVLPADHERRQFWSPMALSGGRLLARDMTTLVCLDVARRARGWRRDGTGDFADAHPPIRCVPARHLKWRTATPGVLLATPTVLDRRAYVATAPADLLALDMADGRSLWRHSSDPGAQAHPSAAAPFVQDDGVYTVFGNGTVVCLTHRGDLRWRRSVGPVRAGERPWLWVADGTLTVQCNGIHGLDPGSGRVLWARPAESEPRAAPAVARAGGEAMLVTAGGSMVRVSDGVALLDSLPVTGPVAPQARGPVAYFAGEGAGGEPTVSAVRLSSAPDGRAEARSLWAVRLPAALAVTAPLVCCGRVFLVTTDGMLRALDARTGAEVHARRLPGGDLPADGNARAVELQAAGGRIHVTRPPPDGRTLVFEALGDCALVWQYGAPTPGVPPTFAGRMALVCGSNTVACLTGRSAEPVPDVPVISIAPPEGMPAAGCATNRFEDGRMPLQWLAAGPIPPKAADAGLLRDLATDSAVWVTEGQASGAADAAARFVRLSAANRWRDPVATADLDAIDLASLAGRGTNAVVLSAAFHVQRARYVRLLTHTPGSEVWLPPEKLRCRAWVSGLEVASGAVLHLAAGWHSLEVRAIVSAGPAGRVWMAPRLEDLGDRFASVLADQAAQHEAWLAYVASSNRVFRPVP